MPAGLRAAGQRPQRAGAVQLAPPSVPLAECLVAPPVEIRPLSVYEDLLEGVR